MPVVPKEIRAVRDAILLEADAISVMLDEECEGDDECEEYSLLSPINTSFVDVRTLVNKAIEACKEEHIKLSFALSFYDLPIGHDIAAVEMLHAYEEAVEPNRLVIERNKPTGTADVFFEDYEFAPENFQSLLCALEHLVPTEGNFYHVVITLEPDC